MSKPSVTIVGQGLAGSFLAYFLMKEGRSVTLVDSGKPSASSVSAGIIDPITGKRFSKTWNFDLFWRFAKDIYGDFFCPLQHHRIWTSADECQRWAERDHEAEATIPPGLHRFVDYPLGGVAIGQSGRVRVPEFLAHLHAEMGSDVTRIQTQFDYDHIPDGTMIFCEGAEVAQNPYFNALPFRHSKGEILTIECAALPEDTIYSSGYWIVPIGNHQFRVGATYSWDSLNAVPSAEGKQTLIDFLTRILKTNYTILDHQAGVRPALTDMLPVMGFHPAFPQIGIFNGLGSKGSLQTPFLAHQLAQHIVHGTPIDSAVSVMRFRSKFAQ